MRRTALALCVGIAAIGFSAAPAFDTGAHAAPKAKAGNCAAKRGRGWAPTEAMARFQAWEIVAQTTGNWPIKTDTFKNERYKCKPEGMGYKCDSWMDVCKS